MARRPRLRPTLESLEGRIALSAAAIHAPAVEVAARPVLTPTTYHRVMGQVDWAFDDYKGRHSVATSLVNDASSLVSTLLISPTSQSGPSQAESDTNIVADGQGDGAALEARLRKAVDQLPYGDARVAPLIVQAWSDGGMTPENASLYRDRLKTMVRRYLVEGVQAGRIDWTGPHHPAAPVVGSPA